MSKRKRLEAQAYAIEAVLTSHRVSGHVLGSSVTPRYVRFRLRTALGTKLNRVTALADEIAMTLGARSARVYRDGADIHVEVPNPEPATVHLGPLCASTHPVPPWTAVLGVDEGGLPLLLRLSAADVAHVLIAGMTGSGKTALTRSLLASLAFYNPQRHLQLILIDPKRRGFVGLRRLPHLVHDVVTDLEEAGEILKWLVMEMERRDQEGVVNPRLVVAVDELADLVQVGGRPIVKNLQRLGQRGREAGIHLIACTQKPTASLISGVLKANFPIRLVGAVASPEEAKLATGIAGTGAERLTGRGDFLLISHGEVIRFQAAWLSAEELDEMLAYMRLGRPRGTSVQTLKQMAAERSLSPNDDKAGNWGQRLRRLLNSRAA